MSEHEYKPELAPSQDLPVEEVVFTGRDVLKLGAKLVYPPVTLIEIGAQMIGNKEPVTLNDVWKLGSEVAGIIWKPASTAVTIVSFADKIAGKLLKRT